ncbi:MAG: uroporphyrinogen decarboxylase family protein [Planctomycetota bacterium]
MRIAFSPSVYEHAAFLLGKRPWDVSRNQDLLWKAHRRAYLTYQHDPIVVGIDIYNLEAEAYGAEIREPQGNGIPAVEVPIYDSLDETRALEPFDPAEAGRIPMVIDVAMTLADEFESAKVLVPLSGPFSIAVSLRGINGLLMDIATDPDKSRDFLMRLVEGQVRFATTVAKVDGVDVAFFESAAAPPLLSPAQFREIELPALKETMRRVGEAVGHPVPCVIGGNTEPIIEDVLSTGTNYVICPAETDQERFMAHFEKRADVRVRVNLDPLTVAKGSPDKILAEVDRIIALAKGRPNILLGTGALPYETPPENVKLMKLYASGNPDDLKQAGMKT